MKKIFILLLCIFILNITFGQTVYEFEPTEQSNFTKTMGFGTVVFATATVSSIMQIGLYEKSIERYDQLLLQDIQLGWPGGLNNIKLHAAGKAHAKDQKKFYEEAAIGCFFGTSICFFLNRLTYKHSEIIEFNTTPSSIIIKIKLK